MASQSFTATDFSQERSQPDNERAKVDSWAHHTNLLSTEGSPPRDLLGDKEKAFNDSKKFYTNPQNKAPRLTQS